MLISSKCNIQNKETIPPYSSGQLMPSSLVCVCLVYHSCSKGTEYRGKAAHGHIIGDRRGNRNSLIYLQYFFRLRTVNSTALLF